MSPASQKVEPEGGSGLMFDRIAERYDLLNRVISLGLDQRWRRKLVAALELEAGDRVLDVATGTADVAIAIAEAVAETAVEGLDTSAEMLRVGQEKLKKQGLAERIHLTLGDAEHLPFADNEFQGACVSFGIRNVPDRVQGLREMARVTGPGRKVVILELNEPRKGWIAPFARFHVHHVVPRLGAWLSGAKEYRYLQKSIAAFPSPEDFVGLMEEAGLKDCRFEPLHFGAVTLFVGAA